MQLQLFLAVVLLAAVAHAGSDCYFPWLEKTSEGCTDDASCGSGLCVHGLTSGNRVCCASKAGTTAPACPSGLRYVGLPILCDISDDNSCPGDATCQISSTDFTRDASSPKGVCCSA